MQDVEKFLISFYAMYAMHSAKLLNKIQFNSFHINMWLSSLNSFEENQFYELKRDTFNSVNLSLRFYKKGKNE